MLELEFYITIYFLVGLIISFLFSLEPIGSLLWGFSPIIFTVLYIKSKLPKKQQPIKMEHKPKNLKLHPSFETFVNEMVE